MLGILKYIGIFMLQFILYCQCSYIFYLNYIFQDFSYSDWYSKFFSKNTVIILGTIFQVISSLNLQKNEKKIVFQWTLSGTETLCS